MSQSNESRHSRRETGARVVAVRQGFAPRSPRTMGFPFLSHTLRVSGLTLRNVFVSSYVHSKLGIAAQEW